MTMDDQDDVLARGAVALDRLKDILAEEARLIASGQVERGLQLAAEKAVAADIVGVMMRSVASLKDASRQLPQMESLRQQIEAMQETLAVNLAVLATARSVAEGLLRDVSRRLAPPLNTAYGQRPKGVAPAVPLVLSRAT